MSIKIKNLSVPTKVEKTLENGYLYKDITLDLDVHYSYNSQLNRQEELKDVQAIFDLEAIKNSITNHFLTSPGQKILNPEFGIDLRRFLFDGVDDFTADIIADEISTKLPRSEPRIRIDYVDVVANEDEQQYDVELKIDVPSLGVYGVSLKSTLDSTGYTII